ncbi:MAG TPA: peptidoglycan bridge formation glycyltransferase FemA/FemB family protein, partial [Candidatus Limnocylindrales bacterium]
MTGRLPAGGDPAPGAATRDADPAAWDAFVEANDRGSYLQLTGWAEVKAVNGWSARRLHDPGAENAPAVGAQVLLRRPGALPWAFGYAPRGPVLDRWDAEGIARFTGLAQAGLRTGGRVSHLRIDPEIERDAGPDEGGAVIGGLRRAGWREAPPIQPVSTRVIDLAADEDALWGDLRKKWRQYVNKARAGGVRVVDAGPERLGEFYRIYRETADRAGFLIRAQSAYRDAWDAFGPAGRARLLFAELPDGTPVATLFLVRSGTRVVEPYGGMTQAGADSRANYLLKWEAIRSSKEAGATSYDLWGLAHPGIAHFKTGFGGREVGYVGA